MLRASPNRTVWRRQGYRCPWHPRGNFPMPWWHELTTKDIAMGHGKWPIYRWFTYQKSWFFMAMSNNQMVVMMMLLMLLMMIMMMMMMIIIIIMMMMGGRKRKRRRTATMPTVMIACITRMRRAMVLVTWWSFHGLSSYAPSPCAFGGESLNSVRTSNPQQVTRPSCDVSPIPSFGTCWHTPEKKYDLTMFWPLPNLWDIL